MKREWLCIPLNRVGGLGVVESILEYISPGELSMSLMTFGNASLRICAFVFSGSAAYAANESFLATTCLDALPAAWLRCGNCRMSKQLEPPKLERNV